MAEDQSNIRDLVGRARSLIKAGHCVQAQQATEECLQQQADNAEARYLWSLARLAQDDATSAENTLRRLLIDQPGNAAVAYSLGLSLEKQNRIDEALEAFRTTLALDKNFVQARAKLTAYDSGNPGVTTRAEKSTGIKYEHQIPTTMEEFEVFETRVAEKKRRELRADWKTTPLVARIFLFVLFGFVFSGIIVAIINLSS